MPPNQDPIKFMEDRKIKSPWSENRNRSTPEAWQDDPNNNRQLLKFEIIKIKDHKYQCNNCKSLFTRRKDGIDHASLKSCN